MWASILIVEGETEARGRLYEMFYALGHGVTCVPTAGECLTAMADKRYDLILISETIPDTDIKGLVAQIREFDKSAKIIALTTKAVVFDAAAYFGDNAVQAVLSRDFSTHHMAKAILEILRSQAPASGPQRISPVAEGNPVLVVDDNAEIRRTLELFLAKRGYKVLTAASGEDALMKVRLEKPKVVFLDVRMPGMDGIMALRRIKSEDETIKVVMLTSVQDAYVMAEALKEGASDYLVKPCDLELVDTLITALLLKR